MTISELRNMTPQIAGELSDADIIKAGKSAQKFVNQRLNRLEKAGLRSQVTTGGARKSSLKRINSRAKAERAIIQAKELESNPLSTPGKIHQQMKAAGLQKDKRTGRWSKKQSKDWLKSRQQTREIPEPDWGESDIITTLDDFFEWARANHPEWSSKQIKRLYYKAIEEYNVDPIKFWSADYTFRKEYYDKAKDGGFDESPEMQSDDLFQDDYTDVEDMDDWEDMFI